MKVALSAAVLAGAVAQGKVYLHEDFSDISEWVSPDDAGLGKFELSAGEFHLDSADTGLQTSQDAKFYMSARTFDEFDNKDKDLVIQFTVKHEQLIDCGGGYVKVFAPNVDLKSLNGESPYNIMFGPDICGSKKMVHVIFSNGGENHLITKKIAAESDVFTHAYTLIVRPDNTYSVLVDNEERESGSLADDWEILEPRTINDPEQSEPEDWVKSPTMEDPEEVKPDNWDEENPREIADEEAEKPEDWDDELDGEWERPMVPNPDYRGVWRARRIENPDYKGPWEHPQIPNPDFEDDPTLYHYTSGAVAFDLWQVRSGTIFDDLIIADDVEYAKEHAQRALDEAAAEREQKEVAGAKAAEELAEAEAARKAAKEADFQDEEDDEDEVHDDDDDDDDVITDKDEL